VWDGKIVLGNYIGKCGNISQIDSIEYYRTSDPDRRGGVHWGIDIYFRISVHSGRSNDGALLEIDLGEAKIIGSCVELD